MARTRMRYAYWWVNQNQTGRREVQGGYLWSPMRNANGARDTYYESMREVAPGDTARKAQLTEGAGALGEAGLLSAKR